MFTKIDYVYAVYKEKSFTKAAEKMFISQPSLSTAIKNVEKLVGAPLFERSTTNITLTEIGKEYIKAAEQIMNIKDDFKNKVNDIYDIQTGKIIVGGTNYLSSYVLPKIINKFSSKYPKIEVELVEAHSQKLFDNIKSEEIDLVIDSFDGVLDEYEGTQLLKEKILLCVPKDRNINKKLKEYAIQPEQIYNESIDLNSINAVPIELFKDESFVLLKSGNDMYNRAMEIFGKAKITPNVCFSVDQLNISFAMSDTGMGLSFATDTLFKFAKFGNNTVLYNIEKQNSGRTLYIAHKKNKYCTKAMEQFINTAISVTKGI